MTLLIADDNVRIRRFIRNTVSDLAEEIFECANGAEAIACFELNRPDWVLMDIDMPVCDGIEATRRIKEESPDARIVIVTVHDSATLRRAAKDAGACAYVLKDDLKKLREMLTNHAANNAF